jgi:DNA repair protein RAD16
MLDLIRWRLHADPYLQELGLGVRILHGGMDVKSRNEALKDFREDSGCRVLLMSLKAAGVALNLTVASECYLMDLWWNPAAEMQAIVSRLIRVFVFQMHHTHGQLSSLFLIGSMSSFRYVFEVKSKQVHIVLLVSNTRCSTPTICSGQFRPIRAVRLVAEGTVEERVLQLQEKKRLVFNGTVGRDAASLKMLNVNDMVNLFSSG